MYTNLFSGSGQTVARSCALSRATGRAENWLHPFDVGTVFGVDGDGEGDAVVGKQQDMYEAIGASVVDKAMNVSK